jgi:glycosyltransferase involved in cell wall biosynthesis
MTIFKGKVGLVQRVLPTYRVAFFNALGRACQQGLGVFTGQARTREMINAAGKLDDANLTVGKNLHLFRGPFYLCVQLGLLKWLLDLDPDVLIMEANPRYIRSARAIHWMHKKNRPVIGWGLGAPPLGDSLLAKLRQKRRERFIHQFNCLITYSQTGAEEYQKLGIPKEKIFVAVNAVTPPPAHSLPKRSIPKPGNRLQVLFVGRLQERKNLHNLLYACADLPESLQPKLVIVGDGPVRERLVSLANQIYSSAQFMGALYGEDLEEQFRKADLFVLPGTGGLAIQQAMSFGLPVIAAEADGTQQDLVRPENGWQIPPNDKQALKATLEEALSDLQSLRTKGAESYRIVSEEINLDQMVAVFVDALNRSQA